MKSQIIVIIIAVVLVAAIVHPFTLLVFAATDNHEGRFNLQEVFTRAIHDVENFKAHKDTPSQFGEKVTNEVIKLIAASAGLVSQVK
jgi:hypothetical protein